MPNPGIKSPAVSAERWERIKALFEAALSQAPEQREAFLTKECGSDASLHAEVVELLSGDQNAGSFLADSSTATAASSIADSNSPSFSLNQMIAGRFRIVRYIGRGGMGEVYEAKDEELGVVVALKTIRPNIASEPRALSRFRQEIQLARRVTHPNVCRIFDLERHESSEGNAAVTLLTMEFLRGETLAEYLRRRGCLTAEEAVPLIRQMADGLAAAHEAGVIHRDFKPSNVVLVPKESTHGRSTESRPSEEEARSLLRATDSSPELPTDNLRAVITDFGLARTVALPPDANLSSSTLTGTGQVVGTPQYMAPEQLEGREATPATDIYALGLVAYEMISGNRPFDAHFQRLKTPATPLRKVVPEIDPSLEVIVLRCLEADPAARFKDAGEFLRALAAPAVPPAAAIRLVSGFRRRARLIWFFAAICAFAIPAILILTFDPVLRQRLFGPPIPQRKNLVVLPFTAIGGRPDEQALCDGFTETVTTRLGQVRSLAVPPSIEVRHDQVSNIRDARIRLGATIVLIGTWHRLGDLIRINLALVDSHTFRQLRTQTVDGRGSDPYSLENKVVAASTGLIGVESPVRRSLGTVEPVAYDYYLRGRGYLQDYEKQENIESAIAEFKRAIRQQGKFAPAHAGLGDAYWYEYKQTRDPQWVGKARTECEAAIGLDSEAAAAHVCLGTLYNGTGQPQRAVGQFREALQVEPTDDEAYRSLAFAYQKLGKPQKAEDTYKKAIALRPDYWAGYNWLGVFYFSENRYLEASKMFSQVVALAPDNQSGYLNQGAVYYSTGRYQEAVRLFEESVAINPTADGYSNIGTCYYLLRKFDESARAYEDSLRLTPRDYSLWGNLADAYYQIPRQRGEATADYKKALTMAQQRLSVNSSDATVLADIAAYYSMLADRDNSMRFLRRAIAAGPEDATLKFRAAEIYEQLGNKKAAILWLEKAVAGGYPKSIIRSTPFLDSLRSDQIFQRLLDLATNATDH